MKPDGITSEKGVSYVLIWREAPNQHITRLLLERYTRCTISIHGGLLRVDLGFDVKFTHNTSVL